MKLVTLVVILSLTGGPHGATKHASKNLATPGFALGPELVLTQPGTGLSATSDFGLLQLQLRPGTYTVEAWTTYANGARAQLCARPRPIKLSARRHRPVRVHVFCSIP
jgi:hypothetical protein